MINKTQAKIGCIKHWYRGKKGYGFIRPEDGGESGIHAPYVYGSARKTKVSEGGGASKLPSSLEVDVRFVGKELAHNRRAYKRVLS
jgi:hypothetical protein